MVCAQKELELENEFRDIEEHWNEQVLFNLIPPSLLSCLGSSASDSNPTCGGSFLIENDRIVLHCL